MGMLISLCLCALVFSVGQTAVVPALSDMAESLHASRSTVVWTVTGYYLVAAVLTPIFGRLGDMFGKRRMLLIALITYLVGGTLCGLGNAALLVVVGRATQGVIAGVLPLSYGIIRDELAVGRRSAAVGMISAMTGVGGGFGVLMGGFVVDQLSFRWIFWIGNGVALAALLSSVLFVRESSSRSLGRVDVKGALIFAVGISVFLLAVSNTTQWGWLGPKTLTLAMTGVVVLVVLIVYERRISAPMVDPTLLAVPTVAMANLTTFFVNFGVFGALLLVPAIAVEAAAPAGHGLGMDATSAGALLAPGCLAMLIVGPLFGRLSSRFGAKRPLIVGAALAMIGLGLLIEMHSSLLALVLLVVVAFSGVGIVAVCVPGLLFEAVPISKTAECTGVNALVRAVGASLGAQVSATILAAASDSGGAHTTPGAYRLAFAVNAAVAGLGVLSAVAVPKPIKVFPDEPILLESRLG
jgi:EmrB/QacA subfamily drug resistance transporter